MPRLYQYVHDRLEDEKRNRADLCDIATNKLAAFQAAPHLTVDENTYTRLIEDYLVTVCLILHPVSGTDQTIYGKPVCYPPPTGVLKSDVKRWVLESSLPIPKKDYVDLILHDTLPERLLIGDKYTKVVMVSFSGTVYCPIDSAGIPVASRRYSIHKGWYAC
jgi:hypothetical protein